MSEGDKKIIKITQVKDVQVGVETDQAILTISVPLKKIAEIFTKILKRK